ncbi:MAG: DUF3810 domain-containing protein [Flavobacterium sp.]|nr:DUF3810 domain-containing protein [Flavobacterium sp.]
MKSRYILPFFLLFQIIILQILKYYPEFIEYYYSNLLYPNIANFSRILFAKFPFSVGDCIYGILLLFIIRWFWKVRKTWKLNYKNNFLRIISCLSIFYFLFHMLWALNYYREPLFDKMIIQRAYSDADLLAFTNKLIIKTNAIQYEITRDSKSKINFPYRHNQVFEMNLNGYSNLSATYKAFDYKYLCVKKSLFSLPLTYMGFGGYLNPFTNEAQVNSLFPIYNLPMTSCHEMAHQMGYASESECNFIGFLAAINNDNLYFKYSGYTAALQYCLNNWEIRNPETRKQLLKKINIGILKNYTENKDFWIKYHTPIETGFEIFYDNFLKLNQQKDGLDSYSKFVDLMVNYYKIEGSEL